MLLRIAFAIAALVLASAIAVPAAAQGLSATVYVGNSLQLSIPVTASVGGSCQFAEAPSGSFDAGLIDEVDWMHDFEFEIECNTASRVAVVSLNGGLKTNAAVLDPGYLGLAPYTVELNLVGNATTENQQCAVSTLTDSAPAPCSFRGPASTSAGLRLAGPSQNQMSTYLRVSAPAYAGPETLVSGMYGDTLTITIAAAP